MGRENPVLAGIVIFINLILSFSIPHAGAKEKASNARRVILVHDGSFDDYASLMILLQRMKLGEVELTGIILDGNGVGRCNGDPNDSRHTSLNITALAGYNQKGTMQKIPISQCGEERDGFTDVGVCSPHHEIGSDDEQCARLFPNSWRHDALDHGTISANILKEKGVAVDETALKNIPAVDMLVQTLRTASEKRPITILSLGPKTLVAKALLKLSESNGRSMSYITIVNMGGSTKLAPYPAVWGAFGAIPVDTLKKGNLYAFASHINADDATPSIFGADVVNPGVFSPEQVSTCLSEDNPSENLCDAAEWNIYVDPAAAEIINGMPVKDIYYGTLDATNAVPTAGFRPSLNAEVCMADGGARTITCPNFPFETIPSGSCQTMAAQYMNDSMGCFSFFHEITGDAFWWDPLITASMLRPDDLVQYQQGNVSIDQIASAELKTDSGEMTIDPDGDSVWLAVEPADGSALKADFEDYLRNTLLLP